MIIKPLTYCSQFSHIANFIVLQKIAKSKPCKDIEPGLLIISGFGRLRL